MLYKKNAMLLPSLIVIPEIIFLQSWIPAQQKLNKMEATECKKKKVE